MRGNTPRTAARVLKALRAALERGAAQPAALLHGLERLRNADLRPGAVDGARADPGHRRCARPHRAPGRLARTGGARRCALRGVRRRSARTVPVAPEALRGRWWAASCVAESPELFRLDRTAVRSAFDRASARYESAAQPAGARRTGAAVAPRELPLRTRRWCSISARAPGARARSSSAATRAPGCIALDLSLGMLTEARRHQRLWRRFARVCADAQRLPLRRAPAWTWWSPISCCSGASRSTPPSPRCGACSSPQGSSPSAPLARRRCRSCAPPGRRRMT